MSSTTLLGPQRFLVTAGSVVAALDATGPVAVVNAGWQEREGDDGELQAALGGRGRNLLLHDRLHALLEEDPALATALLAARDAVDELSGLYLARLRLGLKAVHAVRRAAAPSAVRDEAARDAMDAVRRLDAWHLAAVGSVYGDLSATEAMTGSEALARHRSEVAQVLDECEVLVVAGGHVGVLGQTLRLFSVAPRADMHVVAWSAGAMVMTERVVLFHDGDRPEAAGAPAGGSTSASSGLAAGAERGVAEVWDRGLGRVRGVVALPHARRRLRLDDPVRVGVLAERFADATCVLLDDGARVVVRPDGSLPAGTRVLTSAGDVRTVSAA